MADVSPPTPPHSSSPASPAVPTIAHSPAPSLSPSIRAPAFAHRVGRIRIVAIAFCVVLLGAISTIGTAWLCAAFINPERGEADFQLLPRSDGGSDVIVTHRGFGHSRINRAKVDQLDLDDSGNIRSARWGSGNDALSRTRAGWPLRALKCDNSNDIALSFAQSSMRVQSGGPNAPPMRGGWELSPFTGGPFGGTWRAIPYRPVWIGLVANIAFHAAIWFMLIFGVALLRLRARQRAGRCIHCNYDLRSSGVAHERCPECGGIIVQNVQRTGESRENG